MENHLNVPIILGTTRQNRKSEHAAKFILNITKKIPELETFIVDPRDYPLAFDGNGDDLPNPKYSEIIGKADALIIVTPEYNHSFPGSLKRLLDSEYSKYSRKAVAIAGVSSGRWGGVRAIESLIHVTRKLGLLTINKDMQFPNDGELFDEQGNITDNSYEKVVMNSLTELIWLARALKNARQNS